jgi:hypothetical protein
MDVPLKQPWGELTSEIQVVIILFLIT